MPERGTVSTGGVALVVGEAVAVMQNVKITHPTVAENLGDHRSSSDARDALVATGQNALRQTEIVAVAAIDQDVVRGDTASSERTPHRETGSGQNPQGIDLLRVGPSDSPRQRRLLDPWRELLPALGGELLAIAQTGKPSEPARRGQDNGACRHGAGQGTPADLIKASDG